MEYSEKVRVGCEE